MKALVSIILILSAASPAFAFGVPDCTRLTDQQVDYALKLNTPQLSALAEACTQQSHDTKIRARQIGDKEMLAAGRRAGSISTVLTIELLRRELGS